MKVCYISDYLEGGGAEVYINALTKMLTDEGHQVFLVVDERLNHNITTQGTKCFKVPHIGKPNGAAELADYAAHTRDTLSSISKILRDENPQIIHVHNVFNPYLLDALIEIGYPVVKTLHDVRPFAHKVMLRSETENGSESAWMDLMRESIQKLSRIFVFSNFLKGVVEVGDPTMKSKLVLLSPFSPLQALCQPIAHLDEASKMHRDQFDVLFLGRLCYEKGAYEVLQIAGTVELEATVFVMAGLVLDSDIGDLAAKATNVLVEGLLPPENAAQLILRSKVLVFPSLAHETLGFSVIDALCLGTPVVAYNTGAVVELLQQGRTGFLVPKGNIEELKNRTVQLLQDDTLRAWMGQNAREYAQQQFDSRRHLAELIHTYGEVLHDEI